MSLSDAEKPNSEVLVVEDELAMLFAMSALFRDHGREVLCCRTAAEALTLLSRQPGCIILDPGLADGDWEKVIHYARANSPSSRLVLITEMVDPYWLADLERLSPDVVLPKPVNFEQLLTHCTPTVAGPTLVEARTAQSLMAASRESEE